VAVAVEVFGGMSSHSKTATITSSASIHALRLLHGGVESSAMVRTPSPSTTVVDGVIRGAPGLFTGRSQ
jgi:hypothetical protein